MKEASGELSMTAVAVVAIAAIGVVFTTLIWPAIKKILQEVLIVLKHLIALVQVIRVLVITLMKTMKNNQ